ncbi:MAG: S-layer homology domain-containing protein [Chloroflexi bacterium]|nr:S-layer homology domain-containing protein [Chloroflexota bacterium]
MSKHFRAGILLLILAVIAALAVLYMQPSGARGATNPTRQGAVRTPSSSRIAAENSLPGTDEWASIGNYSITSLAAYPGAVSVNAGSAISIYVNSTGSSISARLYRLGYYQNHGARLYATYSAIPTSPQPSCTRDALTGLVRCPWAATFDINTDPAWISGIYLLRIDSNNGYRTFVYFTVRNDAYNADFIVSEPTKTNEAYNTFGCESLYVSLPRNGNRDCEGVPYSGNNGRTRAYQVSFDRPYKTGAGTGGLFVHDMEMVRWLEASGYDVTYISDVDRILNPSILLGHPVYVDIGHDEYWSWAERDSVENAMNAGVNVAFLSGNESYWNIRMADSPVGADRIIICYKDADLDPIHTPPDVTVSFDDPLLNRPENIMLGVGYESWYDDALYNAPWVPSSSLQSWYFDCTGLQPGDVVNNIVGEEWDAVHDNGYTPPGLNIISSGTVIGSDGLPYPQNSTMYIAPSGAKVFAAGSIHWSWGLIDHSYANQVFEPYAVSNDADHRIEQFTANILDYYAGYWDGTPRGCGSQGFYDVGPRPTRTPKSQAPTATGTPPTPTNTRTPASTGTATSASTLVPTFTSSPTNTPTFVPTDTSTRVPTNTSTPASTATNTTAPTDTRTPTSTNTSTPTESATYTVTGTPSFTSTPTHTPTATYTGTSTSIPTSISTSTSTSTPTESATYTSTPSSTPLLTATSTSTPTYTVTPASTETLTGTPTLSPSSTATTIFTATPTSTATSTATATTASTLTETPTPTNTVTSMPTESATYTVTGTPSLAASTTPTATPTGTSTPTTTPTICQTSFQDAPSGSTFYTYITCLVCRGIVSGYADNTFRPGNPVTRGQIAKMVAGAGNYMQVSDVQHFADVPPGSTFYPYIEALTARNIMGGYTCGGPGEGCDAQSRPYFRPYASATRGQVSKIVSNAAGYADEVSGQDFQDVPPQSVFYVWIERLARRGVLSGYPCGGPGEECVGPRNLPYFRVQNQVTRGQSAKIVAASFFPTCQPSR